MNCHYPREIGTVLFYKIKFDVKSATKQVLISRLVGCHEKKFQKVKTCIVVIIPV